MSCEIKAKEEYCRYRFLALRRKFFTGEYKYKFHVDLIGYPAYNLFTLFVVLP
jgi:hypothetical protein